MNNEIKMNNTGQYSRLNNIVIQGTPSPLKVKIWKIRLLSGFITYELQVVSYEL